MSDTIPTPETENTWELFLLKLGYKLGRFVKAGSNKPILLDDPNTVWLVYSGAVDLFAIRLENGEPVGTRRHLFRAEAGAALFGMDLQAYNRGVGLLIVGLADTQLIQLERARLEEITPATEYTEQISQIVNGWVRGLSAGMSRNIPAPRQFEPLESGAEIQAEAGSIVRPGRGVVWVACRRGISRFMGWEELPLIGEDDFLPITEDTWLETVGQNTLYSLNTPAFLHQGFAWVYLENFHRMVLDLITWSVAQELRFEQERLRRRAAFDRSYVETAFSRIASVLQPLTGAIFDRDHALEDPLVLAARLVGQAQNITIKARPDPVDGQHEAQTLDGITVASRVQVREVALRGDWWRRDNGPLLAYLGEEKHPVALLPVSPTRYELHNPAADVVTPVTEEVAAALSPFAHTFYRTLPDTRLSARDVLRFGLWGARNELVTISLMGIAGGVLGLLVPLAIGVIFSTLIPNAQESQLLQLMAVLAVAAIAQALFQITRDVAVLRLEGKLESSVQAAVWDRLLKLPAPFFRQYTAGDLTNRAMGISIIRQALSRTVVLSLLSGIFSVFSFILLFFIDGQLALVATGLVAVAVGVTTWAGWRQTRYQQRITDLQGRIYGFVLQAITGISKLRVAGVESRFFSFWARDFSEQRHLTYKTRTIGNSLTVFNAVYPVITSIALFLVVSNSESGLSTGSFLAFVAAFTQFLLAGLDLSSAFVSVLRVVPIYQRAQPILHALPEVDAVKADPGDLLGEIEVSRVSFRYIEKTPLIINDVSLHIKPGEFVALVGPSGSGKSTLFRMLLGFETPESGAIFFDGQNLAGLDIRSVRRQLGVVLQNSQLITGDIFTNIAGQSQLTQEDAWEAAEMAGLADDIRQMPMEMHTVISAGGSTLSGGQRQRLLIARAIAMKPRILLFDEATSALDNATQETVSSNLERLDATRVVIAHRLSTVVGADRIIVLDKGRIAQEGTYDELMRQQDGLFADLVRRQTV
ncbi:MAG: NHLP bacteriocin export ABC transporter permease/ATPase subunit [Anaerolineaceae bacterium]|nr:NHLP bacteriocin export ABC transporter permease/ATPase subunit [Anaerolineaceae bacterium]